MSDTAVPERVRDSDDGRDDAASLRRARLHNLLGFVPPLANLGMRLTASAELRWFGVGAGVALTALAVWAFRAGHALLSASAGAAYVALVLAGLVNPRLPEVPGRVWISFGKALGRWTALPVFALLYFVAVTPTALLVRLLGKDPIRRANRPAESYWVPREPSPKERFERQF
jgi:hypothetical protein